MEEGTLIDSTSLCIEFVVATRLKGGHIFGATYGYLGMVLTLVKLLLESIPVYWNSLTDIPKGVLERI
jgi:hypothetical protein